MSLTPFFHTMYKQISWMRPACVAAPAQSFTNAAFAWRRQRERAGERERAKRFVCGLLGTSKASSLSTFVLRWSSRARFVLFRQRQTFALMGHFDHKPTLSFTKKCSRNSLQLHHCTTCRIPNHVHTTERISF